MDTPGFAAYKKMLLEVSDCIEDNHLSFMKFRCDQIVKKAESQKITTPISLFSALEQRELLGPNNLDFLKELLRTCMSGKVDGIRVVERYEHQLGSGLTFPNLCQPQAQTFQATGPPQIIYVVPDGTHQPVQFDAHQKTAQSTQNKPHYAGPDLIKEIAYLSRSLGRDWRFYMRAIGVNEDDLESISCDYHTVRERIHQSLLSWQLQEQQCASRQKLIEGLRDISVQRNDLASAIEESNFT